MAAPEGTRWRFDAGSLYPEYLLTGGPGELAVFDALGSPQDLADWAARCRLAIPDGALRTSVRELRRARLLRDSLWRLTWRRIAGDSADPADLEVLNAAARQPALVPQLGQDGRQWLLPTTAAAVLSTVARDAIDVLTEAGPSRLRECEAGDCRLVFLDTSRPGTRRWCSMERCGNRQKVRALRSRRSTSSLDPTTPTTDQGERS